MYSNISKNLFLTIKLTNSLILIRQSQLVSLSLCGKINVFIDFENKQRFTDFVRGCAPHMKRWKHIFEIIVTGQINEELYGEEQDGLKSMRFQDKKRIIKVYCKQLMLGEDLYVFITGEFLGEPNPEKDKLKENQLIKQIGQYEYQIGKHEGSARISGSI